MKIPKGLPKQLVTKNNAEPISIEISNGISKETPTEFTQRQFLKKMPEKFRANLLRKFRKELPKELPNPFPKELATFSLSESTNEIRNKQQKEFPNALLKEIAIKI